MSRVWLLLALVGCGGSDPCDPTAGVVHVRGGRQHDDRARRARGRGHLPELDAEQSDRAVGQQRSRRATTAAITTRTGSSSPTTSSSCPMARGRAARTSFGELVAALQGGYLFALSTQSHDETQTLPHGSAIRIPPYSRIIGSSHLLNATDDDITTTMHLAIKTRAAVDGEGEARARAHPVHGPPSRPARRARRSRPSAISHTAYDGLYHRPLQYKLYYTLVALPPARRATSSSRSSAVRATAR